MKEITQSSYMSSPAQINQQQTDLQKLSLSLMTAPRMSIVVAAVARLVAIPVRAPKVFQATELN